MSNSQNLYYRIFTVMSFFVASITQAGVEEVELKERFGEQHCANRRVHS
jgi:hypothetical protein